ncbi:MAG: hypothetical protein MJA29_05045 [Candidatus Omnitrophica bacterium]|nr:hypothetical protein [Candidatus Omnitrophota bacterium]
MVKNALKQQVYHLSRAKVPGPANKQDSAELGVYLKHTTSSQPETISLKKHPKTGRNGTKREHEKGCKGLHLTCQEVIRKGKSTGQGPTKNRSENRHEYIPVHHCALKYASVARQRAGPLHDKKWRKYSKTPSNMSIKSKTESSRIHIGLPSKKTLPKNGIKNYKIRNKLEVLLEAQSA